MKVYYIGRLIKSNTKDFAQFRILQNIHDFNINDENYNTLKLNLNDFNYLKEILNDSFKNGTKINDKKTINIIGKSNLVFNNYANYRVSTIIYELVQDKNGNLYGKELITGLLFPIQNNCEFNYYYFYNDNYGYKTFREERIYTDENLARFKYILTNDDVASITQVNEYKKFKSKRKYLKFTKNITDIFNENVFKNEIIEKQEKQFEKQNETTKLMEEIEFILELLKRYNIDNYDKIVLEYEKIKTGANNTLVSTDPSNKDLSKFLANVKLMLLMKEQNKDDLSQYLSDVILKYFNKMQVNGLNNEDFSIKDIDLLVEMFLINKDNYSTIEQRKILIKFSMLHLFVIKANIDKINIEDLKESYFSNNIKTIALCIFQLSDEGIINNTINFNSINDMNVEKIIQIIKLLEFNKVNNDKVKNLIK